MDKLIYKLTDLLSMDVECKMMDITTLEGKQKVKLKHSGLAIPVEVIGAFYDQTGGDFGVMLRLPGNLRVFMVITHKEITLYMIDCGKLGLLIGGYNDRVKFQKKTSAQKELNRYSKGIVAVFSRDSDLLNGVWIETEYAA